MNISQVRTLQSQLKALQRRQRREWTPVAGLSHSSIRVLGVIARHEDECQPGVVAGDLHMTTSNVAAALRELEAGGFIMRRRNPIDTRKVDLSLDEAGRRLVADNRSERDGWLLAAIEASLSDDEQAMLIAAGSLIERVSRFREETADAPRAAS